MSPQESMIKMESWGMINDNVINVNVNDAYINVSVKNELINVNVNDL
jgi:hypothetical protein